MPSPSTPFDDPFADLFGNLPDPRSRTGAERATESPAAGGPTTGAVGTDSTTDAAPAASEPAPVASEWASSPALAAALQSPSSRRAARAAAAGDVGTPAAASPSAPEPAAAAEPAPPRAAPRPAATATATLDALFSGEAGVDDVGAPPPPPDKRRRRIGAWVALGIVLLVIGGIGAGGLWVWNTYEEPIREFMGWEEPADYPAGEATGEAMVTIIYGDTGESISQALFDAGVTKTPEAFYDHLIDTRQNPDFQPGVYRLQQRMTSAAAVDALLDEANKLSNTAQLREGLTVEQSLPELASGLALPVEDFEAAVANPADYGVAADTLEGWLFPATYTFDPGVTASDVIRTLVDRTVQSLDSAGVPVERRHEILTIASIIEREARFQDDFYKVSRVIQNRLSPDNNETSGLLQMDSTAQYGFNEMQDGTVSSSAEALEHDNPWNTYVHPGLPIGPIANPGDLAIDAAMHPAEGPWMYFVTVNLDTGETVFTNTGAEHEQAVKQWQQWCADNPDSGC